MSKKLKTTQGICVHKLTYYFPDKDDNKVYEYTGDHSSFCDGIDPEYLKEVKDGQMYTLKEIIDAWENNYGGDMEKDYPRFFKELKRKYEKIKKRNKPQAPSSKLQAPRNKHN